MKGGNGGSVWRGVVTSGVKGCRLIRMEHSATLTYTTYGAYEQPIGLQHGIYERTLDAMGRVKRYTVVTAVATQTTAKQLSDGQKCPNFHP